MTREEAANRILTVLRNPLLLMSIPDRTEVESLATEHNLSALDLLAAARKKARER